MQLHGLHAGLMPSHHNHQAVTRPVNICLIGTKLLQMGCHCSGQTSPQWAGHACGNGSRAGIACLVLIAWQLTWHIAMTFLLASEQHASRKAAGMAELSAARQMGTQ